MCHQVRSNMPKIEAPPLLSLQHPNLLMFPILVKGVAYQTIRVETLELSSLYSLASPPHLQPLLVPSDQRFLSFPSPLLLSVTSALLQTLPSFPANSGICLSTFHLSFPPLGLLYHYVGCLSKAQTTFPHEIVPELLMVTQSTLLTPTDAFRARPAYHSASFQVNTVFCTPTIATAPMVCPSPAV